MTGFTYDELNFQDFCDVNKDILHSSGDVILWTQHRTKVVSPIFADETADTLLRRVTLVCLELCCCDR